MNRNTIVRIAFVVTTLFTAIQAAPAVQIELKSTQYHTFLARGELDGSPFENRTNYSFTPIGDAYLNPGAPGQVECAADARLFKVYTSAHALEHEIYRGHSEAFASAEFVFKPLADASTALGLSFFMSGQFAWGGNAVSLFDLTTQNTVWSFFDEGIGGGNIPWDYFAPGAEAGVNAAMSVPTQLFSNHEYRFNLSSWGSSSVPDSDLRFAEISGLELTTQAVPEPTVGALAVLAAAGMFLRRKRS